MKPTFRIRKEFERENSLYYHIDEVKISETDGEMVRVYDIHDGNEFWIEKRKLELTL